MVAISQHVLTDRQQHFLKLLRSGEIEQADGYLRGGDRMCCLGVMCESYRRQTGEGDWNAENRFELDETNFTFVPPNKVANFFGLETSSDPVITQDTSGTIVASEANDERGLNFDQIATLFEAVFRGELKPLGDVRDVME